MKGESAVRSATKVAGQGAGRGGGRKPRYFTQGGGIETGAKLYTSTITEIVQDTFNTGQNRFFAQFMQS
jgi:hypothetical protein